MLGSVNYVAVLLASVASMAVGFAWYSPSLFGNAWVKAMGLSKKDMESAKKKGMGATMGMAFASTLVLNYVLANVLSWAGASGGVAGAQVAAVVWLGFFATEQLGIVLWQNKSWNLYAINASHWLVMLVLSGAILGAM